jgi:hypothetical protein
VYDGHELHACRDTAAVIATVVRAGQPFAVDLSTIRASNVE